MPSTGRRLRLSLVLVASCLMLSFMSSAQAGFSTLSPGEYKHLLQSAGNGNVSDQMNLGVRYQYGFSVPRDLQQAEFWLHRAAGFGNPLAQLQLGVLYLQPESLTEHGRDALQWFTRASASGQPEAEFNVALMYLRGLGIPSDFVEAEHWLRKADRHRVKRAKAVLATLLLDSAEPQRRREGFELLQRGAKDHDPDSYSALGYCYEFGIGTAPDLKAAVRLYRQAAKSGRSDAMRSLGVLYYSGKGVPRDFAESLRWSLRGCDAGDPASCWSVGTLYLRGEGVPRNLVLAHSYLAVAHGHPEIIAHLDSILSSDERSTAAAQTNAWEKLHALELSSLPLYAGRTSQAASPEVAAGK